MDAMLPVLNIKLVNLAMFLSNWNKVSSCCNAFDWLMPLVDWVEVFKSISNLLNSVSLNCKSVDELKM